eukprot:6201856-Pleurochrysis_carterae.AAC.2
MERMLYGTRTNVEGRFLYGDTLYAECQFAVGLSPYHGKSAAMDGLMTQCLQQMYVDDVFEKRLTNMLGQPCRSVRVDMAMKHAHLAGWELTLFGGVLAETSEPEWEWTPAVPVTAVLIPDTYANGSVKGLMDWCAPVSTQPPGEVAWASVVQACERSFTP